MASSSVLRKKLLWGKSGAGKWVVRPRFKLQSLPYYAFFYIRLAGLDLIRRGKLAGVEVGGRTLVSRTEIKGFKPAPPAGRPRKLKG